MGLGKLLEKVEGFSCFLQLKGIWNLRRMWKKKMDKRKMNAMKEKENWRMHEDTLQSYINENYNQYFFARKINVESG